MLLFNEESDMTSTCGKNRKVVNDGRGGYVTDALITFDVICDLLLNNPKATQNLFVNYMIKKSKFR